MKKYLLLFLKGIGMGSADVVPGVSGGTVALITGIYTELIDSLRAINAQALRLLLGLHIKAFWQYINGNFLLALLSGIATALFSLARLISYCLQHYPVLVWSFFFGLILASTWLVLRQVQRWTVIRLLTLVLAVLLAYWLTTRVPAQTPNAPWFIFLSGAIAICAMILPGISGSFILVLLGKYAFILEAVKQFMLPTLVIFAAGCLAGLLSFVRLLSYLLHKLPELTMAALAGFMLGSLNKVWPWKTSLLSSSKGVPLLSRNIMPTDYERLTGEPSYVLGAIACFFLGLVIIFIVEHLARQKNTDPNASLASNIKKL